MMRAVLSYYLPNRVSTLNGVQILGCAAIVVAIVNPSLAQSAISWLVVLLCYCGAPALCAGQRYAGWLMAPTAAVVPRLLQTHHKALCLLGVPLLVLPSLISAVFFGPAVGSATALVISMSFAAGVRPRMIGLLPVAGYQLIRYVYDLSPPASYTTSTISVWSVLWSIFLMVISIGFVWGALGVAQRQMRRLDPAIPEADRDHPLYPKDISLMADLMLPLVQAPLARATRAGYRTRALWQHAKLLRFSLPGLGGEHFGFRTVFFVLWGALAGTLARAFASTDPDGLAAVFLFAFPAFYLLVLADDAGNGAGGTVARDDNNWRSQALLLPGAGHANPTLVTTIVYTGQLARLILAATAGLWCAVALSDGLYTTSDGIFATLWLVQTAIASFAIALIPNTSPGSEPKGTFFLTFSAFAASVYLATRGFRDGTNAADRAIECGPLLWGMLGLSCLLLYYAFTRLQKSAR